MTKVYVGGFKHSLDEMELAKLFMPFGQISTIKMVRDKKTRVSKGCAFIEMIDLAAAEAAVESLNGRQIGTRQLKVSIPEVEPDKPAGVQGLSSNDSPAARYVKVGKPGDPVKSKRPRRTF
jgi:RNA recognition motif-containing protein